MATKVLQDLLFAFLEYNVQTATYIISTKDSNKLFSQNYKSVEQTQKLFYNYSVVPIVLLKLAYQSSSVYFKLGFETS